MALGERNTAYDISVFEERKYIDERKNNIVELPERNAKINKKNKSNVITVLFTALTFSLSVAIVGTILFNQVQLTEITDKMSKVEKQLEESKSENTQLQMKVKEKFSPEKVTYHAKNDLSMEQTNNAKQQAEIDNEKSIVERAKMLAMMRSKNGAITYEIFEPALKDEAGKMSTDVSNAGDTIEVLFTDSNRYYEIDQDGNVSEPQEVVKDEYAGDITKGGRCDGSKENPYEISCIEDLVVLSNMTNGTGIKLEKGQVRAQHL